MAQVIARVRDRKRAKDNYKTNGTRERIVMQRAEHPAMGATRRSIALFRMALCQLNQLRRFRQRLGLRAGREPGRPHQLDQSLAFRFAEDRAAREALDCHVRMVLHRIRHCSLCRVRLAERGIACSAKNPGAEDVVLDWQPFEDAQRLFISAVYEVCILEGPRPSRMARSAASAPRPG